MGHVNLSGMKKFLLLSLSFCLVSCVSDSDPEVLEPSSETEIELGIGVIEKEVSEVESVKSEVAEAEVISYVLDKEASTFSWVGRKVVGHHEGVMHFASGTVRADEKGQVVDGSFVIDMHSINTTDLKGAAKDSLDLHLKNEDFFDVDAFPTATLEITRVTKSVSDQFLVAGDLTIKGITQGITFPASLQDDDDQLRLIADFQLDRTRWGIQYGSGNFFEDLGDRMIDDLFDVSVEVVLRSENK